MSVCGVGVEQIDIWSHPKSRRKGEKAPYPIDRDSKNESLSKKSPKRDEKERHGGMGMHLRRKADRRAPPRSPSFERVPRSFTNHFTRHNRSRAVRASPMRDSAIMHTWLPRARVSRSSSTERTHRTSDQRQRGQRPPETSARQRQLCIIRRIANGPCSDAYCNSVRVVGSELRRRVYTVRTGRQRFLCPDRVAPCARSR